jgi:hypothetical protein
MMQVVVDHMNEVSVREILLLLLNVESPIVRCTS